MTGLRAALKTVQDKDGLSGPMKIHEARLLWPRVVGPNIAAATTAEEVRSGVLFVRARSSAWANELAFYKDDIVRGINERLGERLLTDIHIKAGGRAPLKRADTSATVARSRAVGPSEDEIGDVEPYSRSISPVEAGPDTDAGQRIRRTADRSTRVMAWKRAAGWLTCDQCGALYAPEDAVGGSHKCPLCRTFNRTAVS